MDSRDRSFVLRDGAVAHFVDDHDPDEWFPSSPERNPDCGRTLLVDGSPVGHVYSRWQSRLKWCSFRHIQQDLERGSSSSEPMNVLHAGAGALTLPRYLELTHPGSRNVVLDRRLDLVDFARTVALPRGCRVESIEGTLDSRLDETAAFARYDRLILDLVADPGVLMPVTHPHEAEAQCADLLPLVGGTGTLFVILPQTAAARATQMAQALAALGESVKLDSCHALVLVSKPKGRYGR